MATDIAFCIGILTLLEARVVRALVVFVTAFAIIDDIGGILVIALFYGHGVHLPALVATGALTLLLWAMNRAHVVRGLAFAVVGTALWYAFHRSGIHPTISGVVLGLMIPARPRAGSEPPGGERSSGNGSPLERFVHQLHPLVAFFIMPLFALANAGLSLRDAGLSLLATPVALGVAAGLFVGKGLGIFGLTLLAVRLGVAPIPGHARARKLLGVSVIGGIGFTVALFMAALAFHDAPELLRQAKMGILCGSLAAGLLGIALLRFPESSA